MEERPMSVTQEQVVDYIKNLKLSDVKSLIETLENELGVTASAPVMAMAGAPAAGGAALARRGLRLQPRYTQPRSILIKQITQAHPI